MSEYLRLQGFIAAAQQAYNAPNPQHLVLAQGDQVALSRGAGRRSNSVQVQEQNRRTWDAFLRCASDVLGPGKVQDFCRRYRLNVQNMHRKGLPLLSEHVEAFSVGASRVTTRDLKQRFDQQRLREVSVEQLSQRLHAVNPFPIVGSFKDPREIFGTPMNIHSYFFHNPLSMDKETQLLLSDVGDLTFPDWQERFCKALVNRELSEKQIIPAPGENGRIEYYKVHRKITTGDGLVAYALSPLGSDSTLKPALFFRPTQFAPSNEDAVESYMNDVQEHIGEMGYLAAKSLLDALMRDPKFCPSEGQIITGGYSLGGSQTQRFLVDYWRQVAEATFYSDPSVESELAERFAQEVNSVGPLSRPLRLTILRTKGDLAPCVGEKHVGWGVTNPNVIVELRKFDHKNKELSALNLHSIRVFDNAHRDYHETSVAPEKLNKSLDNERRGPKVFCYEKFRKYWGNAMYWTLYGLRAITNFICAFLGIKILRRSKNT